MANLEITRCYRETGRHRYHLCQRVRLPFEHDNIPPFPSFVTITVADNIEGGESDTETFLGLDDDLADVASVTGEPDVENGENEDDEDAAPTAAADGHEEPSDETDMASSEMSHEHTAEEWLALINEELDEGPFEESDEDQTEESDENQNEVPDRDDFPRILQYRLNLTALSQRYNLYFTAYRNAIHVSRPRSCVTHSLPADPDLVLAPAASRAGRHVVGDMEPSDGHQVNHLIVGLLGEREILLMAYDDGDVIGYYTKLIEDTIGDSYSPLQSHDLVPFFHENVGRSAWGLAIHQKSRLIAVGSNAHVATVFMPALAGATAASGPKSPVTESPRSESCGERSAADNGGPEHSVPGFLLLPRCRPSRPDSLFYVVKKDETGRVVYSDLHEERRYGAGIPHDLEIWVSLRTFNLRIELATGDAGHNLPNVAFTSDEEGLADNLLAVDVLGNLWVMDLMSENPHVRVPCIHMPRTSRLTAGEPPTPRGWGVLSIPESSFLPTKNFHDTLGLHEEAARFVEWRNERWIDISRGLQDVPNNSTVHRWSRRVNAYYQREHRELLETTPWFGYHEQLDFPSEEWAAFDPQEEVWFLRDGSSILRTYETDFELRPFEEGGVGIMYELPMKQMRIPRMGPARLAMERLGTLLLVPELSLVVGASMSGRVALVTLTRPDPVIGALGLKRGFKIEAILPTEQDEDNNLRPLCALYGVAVGPIPQTHQGAMASQKRYRLMIQYYDLTVLSYEISRDSGTNELSFLAV